MDSEEHFWMLFSSWVFSSFGSGLTSYQTRNVGTQNKMGNPLVIWGYILYIVSHGLQWKPLVDSVDRQRYKDMIMSGLVFSMLAEMIIGGISYGEVMEMNKGMTLRNTSGIVIRYLIGTLLVSLGVSDGSKSVMIETTLTMLAITFTRFAIENIPSRSPWILIVINLILTMLFAYRSYLRVKKKNKPKIE